MARPRTVSTTAKSSPLRTKKGKTASPAANGRASQRKHTPSAKVVGTTADTVCTGRVTKSAAARGAASPAKRATSQTVSSPKRAASPAKRTASPAEHSTSPAKSPAKARKKIADPALLLRLARSASPAKADLKSPSPGPQVTGEGRPDVYTRWDLEQFTPNVNTAIESLDGGMKGRRAAWSLLQKNVPLDGNSKAGETDSAKEGRVFYRKLKKALKADMGPEFDEAWKKGLSAGQLGRYLKSTGEDVQEIVGKPVASPPRGRGVTPRSPNAGRPKSPAKVAEGRVSKPGSPSKVRSSSKTPVNPTKTRAQSPLKKVNSGDSGVVIIDQTKEKRLQSPAKPGAIMKGKGKYTASPARPYSDNRGCLIHTRGEVISCTNLESISDQKGKHNPFFETLPAPEVWHRRMPPYFPFGETPLMEAYVSRQIDEDLKRGVAHDEEVQNRNRSVVGRVFNVGQKAASYMGSMVPWKRSEDRRYPPAWSLPDVDDYEIDVFARLGDGKAPMSKSGRA
nr:hypothetical protein B0A51_12049 [Rachicladosporium sp. CCFEE 5018]